MRMVVRNLARKPLKSALSVLGISMAVAIMILGNFSIDSLDYMIDFQFRLAQRQDLTVTFVEPATASVMYEMREIPGVIASETMRTVATRIHFGHRSKRIGIMGLERDPKLYRLLDAHERVVKLPEFGIMLNTSLARKLGATLGDVVTIEVLEGKRPTVSTQVTALVEEYAGLNAYMTKQRLHRMLKESSVATGAFLSVDSERIQTVFQQLQQRPGVGSVLVKNAAIQSFEETIAENLSVMRGFIIMFASVIAIGVVYNSARISLSEQSRDLATMRVVGFTQSEVSLVLLGEIIVFTIAAIPLGWLIGYAFASSMVAGLDTDNYRIPLVVSPHTFALAAAVVVIATFFSGLVVQRQVSRLDLVAALKTRE
jgi:putative ABC transport system permease protein